jgi:hypothetical protein
MHHLSLIEYSIVIVRLGSKMICAASGSQYSHSALVLKPKDWDPDFKGDENTLYLTESTSNMCIVLVYTLSGIYDLFY